MNVSPAIFYPTQEPALEPDLLRRSLMEFLGRDPYYKEKFLQSQYEYGFDGYSFLGQEDSLNQYPEDQLFSFVLSTETPQHKFPTEFHRYLQEEFPVVLEKVKAIEMEILKKHFTDKEIEFYKNHITHMISCNYYPAGFTGEKRLTAHPDASLLSVFPYGNPKGLMTESEGKPFSVDESVPMHNTAFVFSGYLSEFLTQGRIKAFNHWVDSVTPEDERFSFAIFSIPKREAKGNWGDANSYFRAYLELF